MERSLNTSLERLDLLTAREAASYLRVSLSTLNRMEQRGLLKPLRTPGGHRRYTVEMLNECLVRDTIGVEVA
jgi:excisionase family DNA binding protein